MSYQESFTQWLNEHYATWTDQHKTLTEWSAYLEIDQNLLSRWLGGKALPENENIEKLAKKLGNEIYEALGQKPPNALDPKTD
jgi:hypothetical protein